MFGDLKAFTATCYTLQPEGLLTCVPGTLALPNIIWEACARVEAIAPAKEQRRSCILSNAPRYPNRRSPACCPSDFCTHAMVPFSRHPKQWSRLSRADSGGRQSSSSWQCSGSWLSQTKSTCAD